MTHALGRPEVDLQRLALFGFSWGGHVVMKGAEYDRRIGALIANPAMPDVFRVACFLSRIKYQENCKALLTQAYISWLCWRPIAPLPTRLCWASLAL